ncbi:hypothetical protein [Spartinivicinus ruber]|uniref:hypothetical protein n=1 Tax=Spartinivicinus ruber TaxID=2683272 RepID=UPI0013D19479|nr:hypothetical protein [Spartinivicinus ruber]
MKFCKTKLASVLLALSCSFGVQAGDNISYQEAEANQLIDYLQTQIPEHINATITYTETNEDSSTLNINVGNNINDLIEPSPSRWIKARTKCTYFHINAAERSCSLDGTTVIGRATLKRGTYPQACKAAKKAANDQAPRGCRAKHCSPCTYE